MPLWLRCQEAFAGDLADGAVPEKQTLSLELGERQSDGRLIYAAKWTGCMIYAQGFLGKGFSDTERRVVPKSWFVLKSPREGNVAVQALTSRLCLLMEYSTTLGSVSLRVGHGWDHKRKYLDWSFPSKSSAHSPFTLFSAFLGKSREIKLLAGTSDSWTAELAWSRMDCHAEGFKHQGTLPGKQSWLQTSLANGNPREERMVLRCSATPHRCVSQPARRWGALTFGWL